MRDLVGMPLCSLQSFSGSQSTDHTMDTDLAPGSGGYASQPDVASSKTSHIYDVISDLNVTLESATNRTLYDIVSSLNVSGETTRMSTSSDGSLLRWIFSDIQLVKAIVLVVVITVLLLSTGRLIFKTFSGVGVGKDDCV